MIYKEFPRALSPVTLNVKGNNFTGPYTILKDEIGTVMVVSKDQKTIGLKIIYSLEIVWFNNSRLSYERHAIVELPKGDVKPALTFIMVIVRDNMKELHAQFEEHPDFPKSDLVFTQGNFDTVKQMWEHFKL